MLRIVAFSGLLALAAPTAATANCYLSPLGDPGSLTGQSYRCSDGSSGTYRTDGTRGDSIRHRDSDGGTTTYRPSPLSRPDDLMGQTFRQSGPSTNFGFDSSPPPSSFRLRQW
ncbi:hypothetical protein [Roseomonas genomospecies 6]|nr:hypothetical protein [Roseomonas genomospecies 6]